MWFYNNNDNNNNNNCNDNNNDNDLILMRLLYCGVLWRHCSSAGCWSERTEVHKAASQGQAAELQTLIRSGESVNMVAVDSITPLHEACIRGQAECVRLLLDAGAQVSSVTHLTRPG